MKFTKHLANEQIINKVKELKNSLMREGSHGFDRYGTIKIVEAISKEKEDYKNGKNAAISLVGVVLGANRNWEKVVQPNLNCLGKRFPNLTFHELKNMLSEMDWKEFKDVWGHRDEKKYHVLSNLMIQILRYKEKNSKLNDLDLMEKWVKEFDLKMLYSDHEHYKEFPGSIKNIGIATFQHLRLTYGVDTVKPDQRVKEVLRKEFGLKLSDKNAILAVEEIAKITNNNINVIDKIFVKYGSGYYRQ